MQKEWGTGRGGSTCSSVPPTSGTTLACNAEITMSSVHLPLARAFFLLFSPSFSSLLSGGQLVNNCTTDTILHCGFDLDHGIIKGIGIVNRTSK